MQLSFRFDRVLPLLVAAIFGFVSAVPTQAQGQVAYTRKVYQGSYIITPPDSSDPAVTQATSLASRQLNLATSRTFAHSRQVVVSKMQNAAMKSGAPAVVPYSADEDLCPQLISSGAAKSCSPNWEVHVDSNPNDPSFGSLWGLSADEGIDAPAAWELSTGSNDVVVAVIDTGVDYTHPDLAANIWTNPSEIPGNNIDDDGDGVIDDVHGADFVGSTASHGKAKGDPMDRNSHGTHVAGTIGAVGNNARGVTGINWTAKIMGLRFLDANGSGSVADAIAAIDYMIGLKKRGVNIRVANNSWGGKGRSDALYQAINEARDAGIIFVAAAGNDANDNDAGDPDYPASYDSSNIVSVAAIDHDQNLASFSSYGASSVDIAAPGVAILSTVPGGGYASYSGTSMATPHVAGALALLFASEPNLSMNDALTRLYESAVPLATLDGFVRTGRKLNVNRMLRSITAPVPAPVADVPCHYSMEDISFNPDTSLSSEPVVLQSDEPSALPGSYYALSLPFAMPFYRKQTSNVYVSPNGVLYMKSAPTSMDFENGSHAPFNSIAALQADMTATVGSADGVHVKSTNDQVTVYWEQKYYDALSLGNVKVWVTLHSSGVIDQFVSFGSHALEKAVRSHATIGIAGPNRSMVDTFAVNNSNIRSGLGLRYVPHCDGSEDSSASVRKVSINSYGRELRPGNRIGVRIDGTGFGSVTLGARFNGQTCEGNVSGYMQNGRLRFAAALPTQRFERFALIANGKKANVKVRKVRSSRSKRLSTSQLQGLCNRFFNSIR